MVGVALPEVSTVQLLAGRFGFFFVYIVCFALVSLYTTSGAP
jgi:hypothetical protein